MRKGNFLGKLIIKLKLKVKTGLHIGGSREVGKIGEVDNPVVKLSLQEDGVYYPYIPGSSLKGKMRHLLEIELGKPAGNNGKPHSCEDKTCEVCTFFGSSGQGIGEAIFRDFYLTEEGKEKIKSLLKEQGSLEIKFENVINRETGQAKDPRQMERVPKGTEFEGEIVINIFGEEGRKKEIIEKKINLVKTLIKLLEDDYLGGSGTRGYGKVDLEITKVKFRPKDYYECKDDSEETINL